VNNIIQHLASVIVQERQDGERDKRMLVHNDIHNTEHSWVGVDIYQTLIFPNVTLYLATGLALPTVPRIGEIVEVFGNIFAGTVENIKYQAHYDTFYRDNPDKLFMDPKDKPRFNDCTIKIDLEKTVSKSSISSYAIEESFIDCSYKIMASRRERPIDFKERQALRNEPDYKLHFLQDVYSEPSLSFDADAFDEMFPEVI
jgi:hypothetical protein